jgi:hypothetical protein
MSLKTPIGFIIFNRPDVTKQVFSAIAQVQPEKLFVIADGPRSSEESQKCEETRAIIKKVNWKCEVITNFSDINLGCGHRESTGFDWVFSQVEQAIFLEDDTLPTPSFFSFCEEMLDRYRYDERVMHINGDNSVNPNRTDDSYYFSKYVHSWGWASWRRAWKHYDYQMKSWSSFKDKGLMAQICDDPYEELYWTKIFEQMYNDTQVLDTWDYQWIYTCWSQNGLAITPNKNLISNLGFNRPDAAHTVNDNPRSKLPVSDVWQINHPKHIVRHKQADIHSFHHIFGNQSRIKNSYINVRNKLTSLSKKLIYSKSI